MSHSAAAPSSLDWLGFPSPFPDATCYAPVPDGAAVSPLGVLLNHSGDALAREATDVWLWYDAAALHVKARCHSASMARVRQLAARPAPYARDAWGDDALEISIDVRRTRRSHGHVILPPNGLPITFIGSNNRQEQGWHPPFEYRVELEADAWVITATFPFAALGCTPVAGESWGFNVLRVNADEPQQYVQWAPTFGDALRTELFGEIRFAGPPGDRAAEVTAYAQRAAARATFFLERINALTEEDARRELGATDWAAWGQYLATRAAPVPLRWEAFLPGRAGIAAADEPLIMQMAETLVRQIGGWTLDPPDPAAFAAEPLEVLGDAYLLTGDRRFVAAFERALEVHARRVREITVALRSPHERPYTSNPYHDAQIIRAEMLAYGYLTMRGAGLQPQTHGVMMLTILRGCRFAAHNISSEYTYGNHQVYESGGLAAVAALFPEFPESDQWAQVAARSIRLHLERELYPDGGYRERCGYHSVAMSYAMHAVATIRVNHVEHRFAELMSGEMLGRFERMHEWLLMLLAPDGTMPAFGDCGASSMLRFLQRGAAVFARPDLAWPLQQLAPARVPSGITPRLPACTSVSLASQFTVLRGGWTPTDFFLAVDHGPLGGQHSHLDTMGFVAYAHGHPVVLDTGIGISYEDPRYTTWFRALRAHNVVAVDDLETEKVAERVAWESGGAVEFVCMRSHAYGQALGVVHARSIAFVRGVGWFIHDRLTASSSEAFAGRQVDWLLHTPYALVSEGPGVLHAAAGEGGLLVLAGRPETLAAPTLEKRPGAVPLPAAREMRLWDAVRVHGRQLTQDVTALTWRHKPVSGTDCEFAVMLLPYRGSRPQARLVATPTGWTLKLAGRPAIPLPSAALPE